MSTAVAEGARPRRAPASTSVASASAASTSATPKGRIRQANEADILAAAEKVFARAGYAGATMAEIAAQAGVPKSNLHYYFRTKQTIYHAVLTNILDLWLTQTDCIEPEADPRAALTHYIRAKMRLSAERPDASRVFANELIHGAREIHGYLSQELRLLVDQKAGVIAQWIGAGKMAPVDPRHLFFTLWAATQTYADFDIQVSAVLGTDALTDAHMESATQHLLDLVLRGCGLLE
ncbi:TetR/AcrR family transcriptional regulator [Niveibacterium sp. SC-1]|uniref:TetR/AcrR family transcriptional regulator n=1 Tax=Niveibacterium sp. SC-1 TaxID=3135646 RepID=UPI00311E5263